jgi:hypothetical protein
LSCEESAMGFSGDERRGFYPERGEAVICSDAPDSRSGLLRGKA